MGNRLVRSLSLCQEYMFVKNEIVFRSPGRIGSK